MAAYEGRLPEADVKHLLAQISAAFRLTKRRRDYDPGLVYEGDGFYLAMRSSTGRFNEMFGDVETRPEEVRALVTEMSKLQKILTEVPPAYAYLTSRRVEKDRLQLLKSRHQVIPTPITSLPADLQSLLIPVVSQPRNFYPITQAQYNELRARILVVIYKGSGYELTLLPSEAQPN